MKWLPVWRYSRKTKEIILSCPHCHFRTGAFDNKPAVIAFWFACNRSSDGHLVELWYRDYQRQREQQAA